MKSGDLDRLSAAIVEACSPAINLVTPLLRAENADGMSVDLREQTEEAFVSLERKFFEYQIDAETVYDIKFGVAAFADEIIMSSRWEHKYTWMSKPLVVNYFGESSAGTRFFERIDELRADYASNAPVIEFYYTLLQLGFQGKYRIEGFEKLQAYISTLRLEIDKNAGQVERLLADVAVPESTLSYRIAGKQSIWVMCITAVASLFFMVLVYSNLMESAISDSAENIPALQMITEE